MDCEYANRYVAFTELDIHEYKGNIEESFVRVMTYCTKTFGKYAFRKFNKDWRRGPINKALFESWSLVLSNLTNEELDLLVERKIVESLTKRIA